jgi:ribosomal protein S4
LRSLPISPVYNVGRRRNHITIEGLYQKVKRMISLYYGGRIRLSTFRKYGKKGRMYIKPFNNEVIRNQFHSTGSFFEHRLDVICIRSLLVKSIFQARQLIQHGKVLVGGKKVTFTNYLVGNCVPVTLLYSYRKSRKIELTELALDKRIPFFPPVYMYVDYKLLIAYILYNPLNSDISFGGHDFLIGSQFFAGVAKHI